MKSKEELQKLANEIIKLEKECQKGKNISKNTLKINEIAKDLNLTEIFQLTELIEEQI